MAEQFTLADAVVALKATGQETLSPVLAKVKGQLDQIKESAGQMGSKLSSAFGPLKNLAIAAGVGLSAAAVLKLAADSEVAENRFTSAFKGMEEKQIAWADKLATSLGRGRTEVLGFMATTKGILDGLEFDGRQGAAIAENLIRSTYDIAAAKGMQASEVHDIIRGAMLGEVDGLKRLGVAVNEQVMAQQLLKMGFKGTWGEASTQQKALAALAMIQEKTAGTQGAAAGSADTLRGMWDRLAGTLANLGEMMGRVIGPAFREIINVVQSIVQAINANRAAFVSFGETVGSVIAVVTRPIATFFKLLSVDGASAFEYLTLQWEKIKDRMMDGARLLGRAFSALFWSIVQSAGTALASIPDMIAAAVDPTRTTGEVLVRAKRDMGKNFANNFGGLTKGLGEDSEQTKAQEQAMTAALQKAGFKDINDALKKMAEVPAASKINLQEMFAAAKPGMVAAATAVAKTATAKEEKPFQLMATAMDQLQATMQRESEQQQEEIKKNTKEAAEAGKKLVDAAVNGQGIKVQGMALGWG